MSEAANKTPYQPPAPELGPGQTSYTSITEKISGIVQTPHTPLAWFICFAIGFLLLQGFMIGVPYLLFEGIGIWGLNNPIGWGWAIINFVWWIGIGHAGTLISAILLLFRQRWRTSINRAAEGMTIFAVICAMQFPLFHTGRPWLAVYWLLPYPNSMDIWPQFRSPLIWDVFAVSTYLIVSLVFWYVGLVPDFANMRDHCWPHFRQAGNDPAQEPGVTLEIWDDDGSQEWNDLYARLQNGPIREQRGETRNGGIGF